MTTHNFSPWYSLFSVIFLIRNLINCTYQLRNGASSVNSSNARYPQFKWAGREHWDSDLSPVRLLGLFMNGPNKEARQNTRSCQLLPDSNSLWAFICCEGLLLLCMLSLSLSFPGQRSEIQCNSIACVCGFDFLSPLCNFLLWKRSCKSKFSDYCVVSSLS